MSFFKGLFPKNVVKDAQRVQRSDSGEEKQALLTKEETQTTVAIDDPYTIALKKVDDKIASLQIALKDLSKGARDKKLDELQTEFIRLTASANEMNRFLAPLVNANINKPDVVLIQQIEGLQKKIEDCITSIDNESCRLTGVPVSEYSSDFPALHN